MTDGAREQRMRRTRRALVAHARRLTAERGLSGFTVDELCAEVGISRRTFFNYFASKDDAVLGTPARDPLETSGERFVAGGQEPDGPGLLDALQELVVRSFDVIGGPHDGSALMDALQREPVLLRRLTESMERHVAELAQLIARRQGSPPGDPFPRVAADVVAHLAGRAVHEFLATRPSGAGPDDPAPREEFAALLGRNVRLAAALFAPSGTGPEVAPDPPPDTEGTP